MVVHYARRSSYITYDHLVLSQPDFAIEYGNQTSNFPKTNKFPLTKLTWPWNKLSFLGPGWNVGRYVSKRYAISWCACWYHTKKTNQVYECRYLLLLLTFFLPDCCTWVQSINCWDILQSNYFSSLQLRASNYSLEHRRSCHGWYKRHYWREM